MMAVGGNVFHFFRVHNVGIVGLMEFLWFFERVHSSEFLEFVGMLEFHMVMVFSGCIVSELSEFL